MLRAASLLRCLIACWAMLPLLSGCHRPDASQATSQTAASARPAGQFVIGVSLWKTDDPWRAQMKADIEAAAAKHPNVNLVFKDAQDDAQRQRADVQQYLAERVNLIIVSPKDTQTMTEPVAKAFDAGVAVIVVDRSVVGDKYTCHIAPDNRQIGTAAGKWLAEKLGGKGKIVEIKGPVDSVPNEERHAAFDAVLRDPGYRFVYESYVDPPRIDAGDLMREALERVEQIDAVYAYTDEAGQAAYEVAKAAGREKNVLFFGIGGLPSGGQAFVSQGILDASFLRPTGGNEAIDTAMKLLAGQKVPKAIVLGTRLFTRENVQQGGAPIDAAQ